MADTNTTVEWRPVAGFPGYEVSDSGLVRSWNGNRRPHLGPRVLKQVAGRDGYYQVSLFADEKLRTRKIAHLVAAAWHGPRPDGQVIRHLDGCKTNDTPSNLRYGTQRENCADTAKHGKTLRGEKNHKAVLCKEDVLRIVNGDEKLSALSREYGVGKYAIWAIRNGLTWRHVTGLPKYVPKRASQ